MPRAVRVVGLAISLAFTAFVLGSLFLPSEVRVERRVVIDRPVEVVYGVLDAPGGAGRTIVERVPNERVRTELDYGGMGRAFATLELKVAGSGTEVVWTYEQAFGRRPLRRWSGLALPRLVGADGERELATLKSTAEGSTASR
jgi:hypothetical protein